MRIRSMLAVIPLLIVLGCVETADPTGPQPNPNPDDGGEVIGSAADMMRLDAATTDIRSGTPSRRR